MYGSGSSKFRSELDSLRVKMRPKKQSTVRFSFPLLQMTLTFISLSLASLLVLFLWFRKPKVSRASLPPGPKPLPLLGNILDLTLKELWLPAFEWAKQHGTGIPTSSIPSRVKPPSPGDVVYIHVLGQGLVFLNSAEAAFDLLDKRGSIYSDKPSLVMAGEL